MEKLAELAGRFAAHALWSVSDGSDLIPILAADRSNGQGSFERLVADEAQRAVELARERLAAPAPGTVRSVLVFDGFVTLETGRTDALIVEALEYLPASQSLTMVVPYRNAHDPRGFAVHRPKFFDASAAPGVSEDYAAWGEAFFRGVDSHEAAAAVWNRSIDDSI